jgi:hypothetical protein
MVGRQIKLLQGRRLQVKANVELRRRARQGKEIKAREMLREPLRKLLEKLAR